MTDQMMLKQYAGQVEQLQAQIKARELAVQDDQLAKERDQAIAKVDELQTRSKKVGFLPPFLRLLFGTPALTFASHRRRTSSR